MEKDRLAALRINTPQIRKAKKKTKTNRTNKIPNDRQTYKQTK